MPKCKAKNRNGSECNRKPKSGQDFCCNHTPIENNEIDKRSLYKPEYCEQLLEYFNVNPVTHEEIEIIDKKTKEKKLVIISEPADLPTAQGFCFKLRINRDTFYKWRTDYPDFAEAYSIARQQGEHILIVNALKKRYDSSFASLLAQNCFEKKWTKNNPEEKKDDDKGGTLKDLAEAIRQSRNPDEME